MLYKTTINYKYPALKAAWEGLKTRSEKRAIVKAVGVERTHLWRLLNKQVGDEPMRAAYLTILEDKLGVKEELAMSV
jgi:hypothetical protein